jgi:hypothetical protein
MFTALPPFRTAKKLRRFFESQQNGTLVRGLIPLTAQVCKAAECPGHTPHRFDPSIQCHFLFEHSLLDLLGHSGFLMAKKEKIPNFFQGESTFFGLPDKENTTDRFCVVDPVAAFIAVSRVHESFRFVIADRIRTDPGFCGKLSDRKHSLSPFVIILYR